MTESGRPRLFPSGYVGLVSNPYAGTNRIRFAGSAMQSQPANGQHPVKTLEQAFVEKGGGRTTFTL